ncbi:MAG: B12-binding domain-containing radical SAM protein [Candidatus Thiodiazotropha sp. (ex Dulcina madagascariensis)]|nr:B12-binding domain-containing radical SAM protein [Candidatus Thiodiazotropha sp. (ex Dulcina madagascariensis)]MCU7927973.1 B12-binding domain-containing radical SAM protein [Candidatus Thiodiazotropha sp. (ex Dulcina madagascariensis)]
MKRLLLIKPPESSDFNFGAFSLGVLAAAVQDLVEVTILDATRMPQEEAADIAWRARPDWLGITAMGVTSVSAVSTLLRQLRKHPHANRKTLLMAGGHGATGLPQPLLEAGADLVVLGEGEITLRRILSTGFVPGMEGTACLLDGRLCTGLAAPLVAPLDALLPPARHLMPPPEDDVHLLETSRGCPHACEFCETTRFFGRRWRYKSPERVVEEARHLLEEQGAWIIHICDDNFTASRRRVRSICELLSDGPLPPLIMVSARADDLAADQNLLPAMASANMLRIAIGVETLDPRLAAAAGKSIAAETYRSVFDRMRELGMFSVASFIVGLPGEDASMRQRNLSLAVETAPDCARFVPFIPMPGVPMAGDQRQWAPDSEHVREAYRLNREFLNAASVHKRLKIAAAAGGVRSILARGVLEREKQTSR